MFSGCSLRCRLILAPIIDNAFIVKHSQKALVHNCHKATAMAIPAVEKRAFPAAPFGGQHLIRRFLGRLREVRQRQERPKLCVVSAHLLLVFIDPGVYFSHSFELTK